MKVELSDVLAVGAVVASAVGFYFVGRYHEDYLNEKREKMGDVPPVTEPVEPAQPESDAQ